MLQCVAGTLAEDELSIENRAATMQQVCCSVLQRVAVCCSVMQCDAVCCGVLQCIAVFCRHISRGRALY